jgi:hypothetical protein
MNWSRREAPLVVNFAAMVPKCRVYCEESRNLRRKLLFEVLTKDRIILIGAEAGVTSARLEGLTRQQGGFEDV